MIIGPILAVFAPFYLLYLFAALFLSLSVMLFFSICSAIAKGEVRGRFGSITFRHATPIGFWFQIGVYVLFAGFSLFSGLALLGLAPHWFLMLLRSMRSGH
jgi:hypothetical protein